MDLNHHENSERISRCFVGVGVIFLTRVVFQLQAEQPSGNIIGCFLLLVARFIATSSKKLLLVVACSHAPVTSSDALVTTEWRQGVDDYVARRRSHSFWSTSATSGFPTGAKRVGGSTFK